MNKRWMALGLILGLLLCGCSQQLPQTDAAGNPWQESWVTLGYTLGAETLEGWALQRSEDVLAAEGIYYTLWTSGEALTQTNEAGDSVTTYDGEIHLMVEETPTPEAAAAIAEELNALTLERYPHAETGEAEYAGQAFRIWLYEGGASATGQRGSSAIRVDIALRNSQEPARILADFLEHCHYPAE